MKQKRRNRKKYRTRRNEKTIKQTKEFTKAKKMVERQLRREIWIQKKIGKQKITKTRSFHNGRKMYSETGGDKTYIATFVLSNTYIH